MLAPFDIGPPMHEVTFEQLRVRLGSHYAFTHQGDCTHTIVVSEMRCRAVLVAALRLLAILLCLSTTRVCEDIGIIADFTRFILNSPLCFQNGARGRHPEYARVSAARVSGQVAAAQVHCVRLVFCEVGPHSVYMVAISLDFGFLFLYLAICITLHSVHTFCTLFLDASQHGCLRRPAGARVARVLLQVLLQTNAHESGRRDADARHSNHAVRRRVKARRIALVMESIRAELLKS